MATLVTDIPGRSLVLTILLGLALLAGGCSDGGDTESATTTPSGDPEMATYDLGLGSFQYPASWEIQDEQTEGEERSVWIHPPTTDGELPSAGMRVLFPVIAHDDLDAALTFHYGIGSEDGAEVLSRESTEVAGASQAVRLEVRTLDGQPGGEQVPFLGIAIGAVERETGRVGLMNVGAQEGAYGQYEELITRIVDSFELHPPGVEQA